MNEPMPLCDQCGELDAEDSSPVDVAVAHTAETGHAVTVDERGTHD